MARPLPPGMAIKKEFFCGFPYGVKFITPRAFARKLSWPNGHEKKTLLLGEVLRFYAIFLYWFTYVFEPRKFWKKGVDLPLKIQVFFTCSLICDMELRYFALNLVRVIQTTENDLFDDFSKDFQVNKIEIPIQQNKIFSGRVLGWWIPLRDPACSCCIDLFSHLSQWYQSPSD